MVPARLWMLAGPSAVLLWYLRRRGQPRKVRWLSAPPFLGCLLSIIEGLRSYTLMDWFDEQHRKYGMTFAFQLPGKVFVATVDPRNIEHCLKKQFSKYVKGALFTGPFTALLGKGIFNVDGDQWFHQRKLASRLFTKKQFEDHIFKVVEANTSKVANILAQTDGVFDMFDLMNRFTLDTIGETGFSQSIGSLENPSSPFLKAFDRAQQISLIRFWLHPYWKVLRFFDLWFERELKTHLACLDEYARGILKALRKKLETGEDNSFVGLFMKERELLGTLYADEETFLRDMVINFLIAGRDTTAQCLCWTLFELLQHPPVIDKARQEIASVCGKSPVQFNDLKKLKYVKGILDEGLRLHPSVPVDFKLCVEADCLPDGTIVPAGCALQLSIYAQGRCTEIWGADAREFRPERWLEMQSRPSSFTFCAFLAGPRECLGKNLADLEMVVLLATLLRDFEFTLAADPASIRYDSQLTLGMNGLPLSVKRRTPTDAPQG